MGKSTISMAIFNSYVKLPEGNSTGYDMLWLTVCHGIDGPNRNRWLTELRNGGSVHGELLKNQMVILQFLNV